MSTTRARRGRGVPLVVLLSVAGCAGAVAGAGGDMPAPVAVPAPERLEVHGLADYDWPLRTLAGDTLRLEALRGRVLFINLWATWCAPCVAELGSIARLRDSLAGTPIEFLLVSPEAPGPVRAFLARHGRELPVYLEAAEMPAAFGLRALPTTFIVDEAGRIVLRHRGAADWDDDAVRVFLRHLAGARSVP